MKIYEIFTSIDGEVNYFGVGGFTTFIRFAGCNFEKPCSYCDTKYALKLSDGKEMAVDKVVDRVKELKCRKVTITGGEPLLQRKDFEELTRKLWHEGFKISVETNGSLPLSGYGVSSWIVDYKLPSSGCDNKMKDKNFTSLSSTDYVKFVILNESDYEKAIIITNRLNRLGCKAKFAFGSVFEATAQKDLVNWLIRDELFGVIVNVQIHKFLGVK